LTGVPETEFLSVGVIENEYDPPAAGMPEIVPAESYRPGGKEPLVTANVTIGVPPVVPIAAV
jgi:hypothetical protein